MAVGVLDRGACEAFADSLLSGFRYHEEAG